MYQDYINNYDETITFINDSLKKNTKFADFFSDAQKRVAHLNVIDPVAHFYSYMITPVQRLPRYILLLRVCIHFTTDNCLGIAKVYSNG